MEYSSAEMICVLKVNTDCEACKVKVMKILQRIRGVYNITIDGEDGTVKVNGRVNPNTLLSVLEKYGKHTEVKYVKFDGEIVERNPNYYGEHGYNYNPYDRMEYFSYPPPLPCPQHQGYHHHYPYFSQPPPMPPPPLVPCQFPPPPPPPLVPCQFPPPPPMGPIWGPSQPTPPPPPRPYGYGPPPMTSFCPPHNLPLDEYTRQNNPNKCAMM